MSKINNRKDILLLVLYSPGVTADVNEPIVGRTRLVKMLYLFKKEGLDHFRRGTEIDESNFYEFHPWNFGPFSAQVYDDITFFQLHGFIDSDLSEDAPLPESEAEWTEWLETSGVDYGDTDTDEYIEESFSLTKRGSDFTEQMYRILSRAQRKYLREFKKRTCSAPLRALLRYVYTNFEEDTVNSQIRNEILGNDRY